jgi:hypothetical protein
MVNGIFVQKNHEPSKIHHFNMLLHFDDIFEIHTPHLIRTKRKIQINGAVLSTDIYIPDSVTINGLSVTDLKGKILKVKMEEDSISIHGVDEELSEF